MVRAVNKSAPACALIGNFNGDEEPQEWGSLSHSPLLRAAYSNCGAVRLHQLFQMLEEPRGGAFDDVALMSGAGKHMPFVFVHHKHCLDAKRPK